MPRWNREQFLARQTKLEKLDRQNSAEGNYFYTLKVLSIMHNMYLLCCYVCVYWSHA